MKKQYLVYASFEKAGKEHLIDYVITARSKAAVKNKAMERMARAGGIHRSIDEVHELTEEFKENEAVKSSHWGARL